VGEQKIINTINLEGVILSPLKILNLEEGDVFHGMKSIDNGFKGFGEAYFSSINFGLIKAWKRHHIMTLNLIVPIGEVSFVIYDDRESSATNGRFQKIILSKKNYLRLTIPPMLWLGFQGVGTKENILLNIADIGHNASEADRKDLNEIKYNWELIK